MSLDTAKPAAPAPETTTPAPSPAPVQDAAPSKPQSEDEALSAIYREAMAADDSKPAPAKDEAAPAPTTTDDAKGTPERDPTTGKFIAKETALPLEASADPEATKEDAPKEPEAKTLESPSEGHFRGWDKAKREAFTKLPKEAQDFVLAHQKELQSAASRKEFEFQQFSKSVSPYVDVLKSERDYLDRVSREMNMPPHAIVGNLMKTERTLRYGTFEQKSAALQQMAKDYGIPVSVAETDPLADPLQPGGDAYRVVHDLQQKIAHLEAQLESTTQARQTYENERAATVLERFKAETGPDGQLLHPLFDHVAPRMSQLIREGEAKDLHEAYRIATEPMRKAIEAEAANRLRAQRADSAQRAGRINVVTQPAAINRFDNEDEALRHAYRTAIAS